MKTFIEKNFWSGLEDYFRHLGERPAARLAPSGKETRMGAALSPPQGHTQ